MAAQGSPRFPPDLRLYETIVDENSDDSIVRVAPGQRLPESLRATYREGFYNEYMQRVFQYLGDQGVRPRDLRAVYESIPPSPGMGELLQLLVAKQGSCFEVILISDANTLAWRVAARRRPPRPVPPHLQQPLPGPTPGGCWRCGPSTHTAARAALPTCARHKVLSDYPRRSRRIDGVHFERLFYVGDGANDSLSHGAAGRWRCGLPSPRLPHAPPYPGGTEG